MATIDWAELVRRSSRLPGPRLTDWLTDYLNSPNYCCQKFAKPFFGFCVFTTLFRCPSISSTSARAHPCCRGAGGRGHPGSVASLSQGCSCKPCRQQKKKTCYAMHCVFRHLFCVCLIRLALLRCLLHFWRWFDRVQQSSQFSTCQRRLRNF